MQNLSTSCVSALLLALIVSLVATLTAVADEATPAPFTQLGESQEVAPNLVVFDFEKGLWVYRAVKELEDWGPVPSNGLIIADDGEVWIIDTPWDDEQTAQLLDWVESKIGSVSGLVATHFHWDRLGGIAEVRRRGIRSWGHVETARLAPTWKLLPPEKTFETSVDLSVGEESFEVFYPGPAHTDDNTVVWFPERGLLYGGCMIKSAGSRTAGNLEDADLQAWPSSLEALSERYQAIRTVIPGHGAPGSTELLEHTLALVKKASSAQ